MAKRGKINMKQITQKVSRSGTFKAASYRKAKERTEAAKMRAIAEFERHPVTKEIEGGPTSSNSSNTLGGYGNLFSFIGFDDHADPVSAIRSLLKMGIKLKRRPISTKIVGKRIVITYEVDYPTMNDFYMASPSPWGGRSWIKGVEEGMGGFGNYMYHAKRYNSGSRSGTGLQNDKRIRSGTFKPMEYVKKIIRDFKSEVRTK